MPGSGMLYWTCIIFRLLYPILFDFFFVFCFSNSHFSLWYSLLIII
jgi:hypothetical protein